MIDSQPIYAHFQHKKDDPRDSYVPPESEGTQAAQTDETAEKSDHPLELPEPDADNITVLTSKLPNKPILPWNHYDSPWQHADEPEIKESGSNLDPSHPIDEDGEQSLNSEEE